MENQFEIKRPAKLQKFLRRFSRKAIQKGESLFQKGLVAGLTCGEPDGEYSAVVQDSKFHQVDLFHDDLDGWDGFCSCREGGFCSHVYATALMLLAESSATAVQTLSDGAKPVVAVAKKSKAPPRPPKPPESVPEDPLIKALGRPLNAAEAGYLKTLGKLYNECQKMRSINRWHLGELGLHFPGYSWDALKIWPSFPETIHLFWLYIAEAAREANQPIPAFMGPVSDLTLIQESMRQWKRQREIGHWKHTLEESHMAPSIPVRVQAEELDLRVRMAGDNCTLEYKTPGMEQFKAVNSKQAKHFWERYEYDSLPFHPIAEILWQLIGPRVVSGYGTEFHHKDPAAAKILGRMLRNPLLAERIVNEEGLPFVREDEPLKWSLTPAEDETGDYGLHLTRADGSTPPPFLMILDGSPPLYVGGKAIFVGPPPHLQSLDPYRENKIPAPALETVAGVQFLEKLRLEPPPRLRERIQRLSMRVTITAELKLPYREARHEFCVMEVTASSADGNVQEKWGGYSWTHTKKSPPAQSPGHDPDTLVFYDRSALHEIPALLEPLQLQFDMGFGRLGVRVTRKFPELFADWLRTVPRHIELHLSGDLASLARDTVSGRVRLEVQESEIDWFDLQVVVDVSDTELTPEEIKLLLNARGSFVRLEGKGWRRMEFALTGEEDERLARLGLNPHELTAEPQRMHTLQLADEAARKFLPAEQAGHIQRRAEEIKARVTPPVPAGLVAELRPYQVEGFHFLAYLSANHFGGILADDMGLGKTLQALAWLLWLRAMPENVARPVLVVCPKSVMDNWKAEAQRFAPGLSVKTWRPGELEQLPKRTAEADIHVLNYSQLRLLGETLVPISWCAVILDEGQYIKNPGSQTAQVARALRASHRLILSGTPIENRLTDLWSLMSFAMPGILGSRHSFGKVFDAKNDPLARRRLSARVRPFLLRRTKSQVARDLPDRIEEDLFCEIEGEQQSLYAAELKFARQLLLKTKTQKQLAKEQFNFLASLLRLRQICCHPALVKPDSKAESAKVNALLEQLEPLMAEGEKVLVFSQFVGLLELLKPVLEKQGWPIYYLTGATENRGELVKNFQSAEGAAIFLISLKAGGFGLNLTAASYVVLFDPWWNPAVENQAIDRTHRIGQDTKVIAYRLLIKGSVEEKIRALQRKKSAMAEDVLGEEKFAQSLTIEDLRFLFEEE